LKYSPECDLHISQLVVQKEAHMLQSFGKKTLTLISNVLRKKVAPNCSHLSPPAGINKNPTKT